MELTRDFSINDLGEDLFEVDSDGVTKILKLSRLQASSARDTMKIVNSNTVSQRLKDQHIAKLKIELMGCEDCTYEDENQIDVDTDTLKLKTTLNAFINFFKDVEFEPSLRFTNSVALCNNFASAVSYITNYFELQGNSYYDIISDNSKANVAVLGGGNYQIDGQRLHRFGVEAGAGITASIKNLDLTLEYNGAFRQDYRSQGGMLKAKYNF